MYQYCGDKYGGDIHQEQHFQFVVPRQLRHVTKSEQRYQPNNGQIKRGEEHAHHPRAEYDVFLFHKHISSSKGVSLALLVRSKVVSSGHVLCSL